MYSSLPQSSEAFEALEWAEIESWYRELAETTLAPDTLEPWLRQWSQLSALVDETNTWLEIATTRNTADETLSRRRERFLDEIFTQVQHFDQQIKQQLLASGLEPEGFAIDLTQADLGDMTGLTPVHVNRTLRKLREANLAMVRDGCI